jgi:hypothetical protein
VRFFAALVVAVLLSGEAGAVCPLDDTLKLCVLNGRSLAALHSGADHGDWAVEALSSPVNPISEPRTGSELYTMPSGLRFALHYQEYRNLFSASCTIDIFPAVAKAGPENWRCSNAELEAFEAGLSAASLGSITKEHRPKSGTAYLIESPSAWMTVVVADGGTQKGMLNAWVETSVLKRP